MTNERRDAFAQRDSGARDEDGALSFLNPTRRTFALPQPQEKHTGTGGESATAAHRDSDGMPAEGTEHIANGGKKPDATDHGIYHVWQSRDNRKGRHSVAISKEHAGKAGARPTNTLAETWRGIWKMMVRYPIWDVSYDVATIFTLGSVVWVINGFFVWLPLQNPDTEFTNETDWGGGVTAFLGATIFEFGSVLLMLEAVNENRTDCFGWALEEAWEGDERTPLLKRERECRHHHGDRRSLFRSRHRHRHGQAAAAASAEAKDGKGEEKDGGRPWQWWPSWRELRTHYLREIGFLACLSQMIGASIFWIAGISGLPPILNSLSGPAENGVYWATQVVGGSGFIVSSFLFMLETQTKWYVPAPKTLGWHIGFWNLIGGIGFTLCGALGFAIDQPGIEYASTLATFIGSWAFLIGSVIQWFESLDKYPVSIE